MHNTTLQITTDTQGVTTVTLNRPELHNAFDDTLIKELTETLQRFDNDVKTRLLVLAANGKSFSAGADLNWMQRTPRHSYDENQQDALRLARLFHTLNYFSKPTIALVQGAAFGGGVGLVACCDIAIAARTAIFSLSEVKIGLTPAVISPYVIAAIGERAARRYFLTAERFDAQEAHRLGLIHAFTEPQDCTAYAQEIISNLLFNGPAALVAAKKLIAEVHGKPIDSQLIHDTATRMATIRVSPEGQEGLAAFLEKRKPRWTPG